jgi:hypothetical protein
LRIEKPGIGGKQMAKYGLMSGKTISFLLIGIVSVSLAASCDDPNDYGEDYLITFNADGGTGTVPPPMKVHAEGYVASFALPDADLSKSGFDFIGWREPGYSVIYSRPGETLSVTEDTELKAVYENGDNNTPSQSDPPVQPGNNSGFYVTKTGKKYHKYGHLGATIPLSQGKHGPYTACQTCF